MLWNLAVVAVLLWADHRRLLGRGQVLAGYVMGYTFGRFFVEALRDDHANRIAGMRVNSWVSILVFLAALAWFLRNRGKPRSVAGPGVEDAGSPDDAPGENAPRIDEPPLDEPAAATAEPAPDQPPADKQAADGQTTAGPAPAEPPAAQPAAGGQTT